MTSFSSFNRETIYKPRQFSAWVTAFDYANGYIGISFTEVKEGQNKFYKAPTIEFGEAIGAPVSYCSAECSSETTISERVYLVSKDGGASFSESGRCNLSTGSFLNMGFEDGHIIGLNVAKENEKGNGWSDFISVKESFDGGSTWQETRRLLEGCAVYLWRIRKLKDGSYIIMASLYGTPWGEGLERATRNTMLPGESYISKIQTFFLHTTDGKNFSEPHYILPGIGAHEYDMAELSNGDLLFIAGDVQATPCGRQIVKRSKDGFINGPLLPIKAGAPSEPAKNPQGGFVPESLICTNDNILIGCRRNKCFSVSGDLGENWYPVAGDETGLYQPVMISDAQDNPIVFGHIGGDTALGQADMKICGDYFNIQGQIPLGCNLSLYRNQSKDKSHYINSYSSCLTCNGKPISNKTIEFRIVIYWNMDGTVCQLTQDKAPIKLQAKTDEYGIATISIPGFDDIRDIHHAYNIDAIYISNDNEFTGCTSPMITSLTMRPFRRVKCPYPAYFAEDTLYISPALETEFKDIYKELAGTCHEEPLNISDTKLLNALLEAKMISKDENGNYKWVRNVHGFGPIKIASQGDGDYYE